MRCHTVAATAVSTNATTNAVSALAAAPIRTQCVSFSAPKTSLRAIQCRSASICCGVTRSTDDALSRSTRGQSAAGKIAAALAATSHRAASTACWYGASLSHQTACATVAQSGSVVCSEASIRIQRRPVDVPTAGALSARRAPLCESGSGSAPPQRRTACTPAPHAAL